MPRPHLQSGVPLEPLKSRHMGRETWVREYGLANLGTFHRDSKLAAAHHTIARMTFSYDGIVAASLSRHLLVVGCCPMFSQPPFFNI